MNPDVKFSCGYNPADAGRGSVMSCGTMIFLAGFLATFFAIAAIRKNTFMILIMLAFVVFSVMSMLKSSLNQYLHVTPTMLQIVRSDDRILKQFALKDIREIYAADRDTVTLMVWSPQHHAAVEETLRVVADTDGLIAAVKKWGGMHGSGAFAIPEAPVLPQPMPQPIQPHIMREDEADRLHAAQHLLNQGMISPKQYSGMLMPPELEILPEQPADINAQNAEDYLHRQELIAQQLGIEPQVTEEKPEKDEFGRTGLV